MSGDDSQDRERDLRERIVRLMRSNEQARKKQVTSSELQKLRTAASRLDQMLKASQDAERQTLKSAASRLDRLLADMRKGKDVTNNLNRR